jgi:hypothetical protein
MTAPHYSLHCIRTPTLHTVHNSDVTPLRVPDATICRDCLLQQHQKLLLFLPIFTELIRGAPLTFALQICEKGSNTVTFAAAAKGNRLFFWMALHAVRAISCNVYHVLQYN